MNKMTALIKVEKNPAHPEGRWFEITGKPQSLHKLHTFKSASEAYNAGFMMADMVFGILKAAEVRLYPFEGSDNIAVFLEDSSDWDRKSGSDQVITVEQEITNYFNYRLLKQNNALLTDMSDKTESLPQNADDIAGRMNAYLQKIKPKTVDEHNGKVYVIEFNKKTGVLTIGLGESCLGCSLGSHGTKSAIAPPMRSHFPEISKVDFIFV